MDITYKEIHDTFNALEKTAAYLDERWNPIEMFLKGKSRFIFMGCGSSYSIAKSMAAICSTSAGIPAAAMAAGDVLLHARRYKKAVEGAAVVAISRSGKTSELLMALEALKSQGCSFAVASLACADDTPLGAKSDLALCMPWAFDESVCQTRSVANFYFTAAYISAKITGDRTALEEYRNLIKSGPEYMARAEELAKELSKQQWTHAVVLADAELEGLAEEGALAFKEICQLPSNYYHMLDVRHGPMVLFGENTLILAAVGESGELEHNLLKDLKGKGSTVVAFSDVPAELEGIVSIGFGCALSHAAKGVPFIVLCQLITYYKSKVTGADPDKPTGLDAWIAL